MSLTRIKSDSVTPGAITAEALAPGVGGGPKISSIAVTDNSYTVLDDTAVDLAGGYIKLTGTGFGSGCQVLINTTPATSVTFVSDTEVRAQVPAATAGTYVVYLVNSDGGVAIAVNGLTYSATPTWVTASTLASQQVDVAISIQFDAADATTYSLQAGSSLPAGVTLTSGGLLSGTITGITEDTTYNFTVVATDAENQDSPRAFSVTVTAVVPDDYFNSTMLLLSGNGVNGAQNNTFVDSSTNSFTVTRSGDVTQGSFSPFSPTGWSIYVPAGGNYTYDQGLSAPASSNYAFGTGDFTVEVWYMQFSNPAIDSCILTVGDGSPDHGWQLNCSLGGSAIGNRLGWSWWGVYNSSTNVPEFQNNRWYHVAVTRSGGTTRLFVDGVQYYSFSDSRNYNVNKTLSTQSKGDMIISNARIVKGTALYTSNFTPSTEPLTAVSGTTFLIGQDGRLVDKSPSAATITKYGNTRILPFSPFAPDEAWSAATHGGSAYFDGTGDNLTLPDSSVFRPSSAFTVEAWIYPSTVTGAQYIISQVKDNNPANSSWYFRLDNATVRLGWYSGGASWTETSTVTGSVITPNQWYHVAGVWDGSNMKVYVNGVQNGTPVAYSSTPTDSSLSLRIGAREAASDTSGDSYFAGYISNLRVVNGTAVYTSNFTPPTTPPTAIANTSLLLNFTNGGIIDATAKNVVETVGNAQVTTSVKKYGSGSLAFDGSGDYLLCPSSSLADFGAGDFTIEMWIYFNTVSVDQNIIAKWWTGGSQWVLQWRHPGADGIANQHWRFYFNGSTGTDFQESSAIEVSTGTWYHIAIVRNGSSFKFYRDGTQIGSTYTNSSNFTSTNDPVSIGQFSNSGVNYFDGYMDDLRITKGVARYTANFTPPGGGFPAQ